MSAIAASACPSAIPRVETKIATGAPMKMTPSVFPEAVDLEGPNHHADGVHRRP